MSDQLTQIRIVLACVKDAYEDYYSASKKYERACSLLSKLRTLLENYYRCIKKQKILTVFLVLSILLLIASFAVPHLKNVTLFLLAIVNIGRSILIPVSVILLIRIIILTYRELKIYPQKYRQLFKQMVSENGNAETEKLKRISSGEDLCSAYEALIETSLLPTKNEKMQFLRNERLRLEPYVSEEYRTYECVCSCITIIDSNRAESLKEMVNLMVDDMKNKEIVVAINNAGSSFSSFLSYELDKGFSKISDAVNKSTDRVIKERNRRL